MNQHEFDIFWENIRYKKVRNHNWPKGQFMIPRIWKSIYNNNFLTFYISGEFHTWHSQPMSGTYIVERVSDWEIIKDSPQAVLSTTKLFNESTRTVDERVKTLIDKYNEGCKAYYELHTYMKDLDNFEFPNVELKLEQGLGTFDNYQVTLKGERILIGCQILNVRTVATALQGLLREFKGRVEISEDKSMLFTAAKDGIIMERVGWLSWKSCEELYDILKCKGFIK